MCFLIIYTCYHVFKISEGFWELHFFFLSLSPLSFLPRWAPLSATDGRIQTPSNSLHITLVTNRMNHLIYPTKSCNSSVLQIGRRQRSLEPLRVAELTIKKAKWTPAIKAFGIWNRFRTRFAGNTMAARARRDGAWMFFYRFKRARFSMKIFSR